MNHELDNPFSVTKATEFSDQEINEYWVDFNTRDNISIEAILNPREYLPKYVIGSKGCGKTHILRYFSFPLQKIRNKTIADVLRYEKYIGLYSVLHGMNSSRFTGKGIEDEQWEAIFEYYFELYICDGLLSTIREILSSFKEADYLESELVKRISEILRIVPTECISSFSQLTGFLATLRRKIDMQILNAAFTRKLDYEDVKVLFSPGDLIFGIPKSVSELHPDISDIKFIYIFDEYEKLFEWQKKFVNTLVWDKRNPTTFWIGARRHGFTTRNTKSGQEMKSGSEFQDVNLDKIIRDNEDLYKGFAEKLLLDRLVKFYTQRDRVIDPSVVYSGFNSRLEKHDEAKLIQNIVDKNSKREFPHIKELRKKLDTAVEARKALGLKNSEDIEVLIGNLVKDTDNNPLFQKYKFFLFFKLWNKSRIGDSLHRIVGAINDEFQKFLTGRDSVFDDIKDKRKKDLLAQLAKENGVKNTEYSGIDKFIELSQGNARHFILTLKKTVENSRIRGEKPLDEGGRISLDAQYLAVFDTAKWFYEDIEVTGEAGKQVYSSLKNLTDYLIQERFCDKPVETTVSCFYLRGGELSADALRTLDLMAMHSILIEDEGGRYDKNSGRKERLFILNKILAPLWNLPTVVRGSLFLNPDIAEAVFNFARVDRFRAIYKSRKGELNAPTFLNGKGAGYQDTLF